MNPFVKGQGAFIKITSLTIGLTVGLVLLAKVQLERNYDRCIVDKEHVYELQETMQRAGEEPEQHGCTSGGIAPVLAREIPEVVTATRYTAQFGEEKLTLEDGSRHYFEQAGNVFTHYIMLKLQRITPENLATVQQLCDRLYPDAELNVKLYSNEMADQYQETQRTRDLVMIGCLASLLITLIGLIGYVRDEVQRRSRELAIRKVVGATEGEVQLLFARSIAVIALPSIVIGVALGWYLSTLLMQQFAYKVPLLWYVFAADALAVILIIAAVVFIQTRRVANDNPVEYLKKE